MHPRSICWKAVLTIPHLSYRVIEHGELNRMSVQNMAIVFGPTLLRPQEESNITMHMVFQNQIVELVLNEFKELFKTKWSHPMERKTMHPSAPSSHTPKWTRLLTVFWLLIGYCLSQSIKAKISQQITSLWNMKRICALFFNAVWVWYCWNQENKKLPIWSNWFYKETKCLICQNVMFETRQLWSP